MRSQGELAGAPPDPRAEALEPLRAKFGDEAIDRFLALSVRPPDEAYAPENVPPPPYPALRVTYVGDKLARAEPIPYGFPPPPTSLLRCQPRPRSYRTPRRIKRTVRRRARSPSRLGDDDPEPDLAAENGFRLEPSVNAGFASLAGGAR
jgi:hypothetical protein